MQRGRHEIKHTRILFFPHAKKNTISHKKTTKKHLKRLEANKPTRLDHLDRHNSLKIINQKNIFASGTKKTAWRSTFSVCRNESFPLMGIFVLFFFLLHCAHLRDCVQNSFLWQHAPVSVPVCMVGQESHGFVGP